MKSPSKWLKDVIVVRFVDNGYKGNLILPEGIKHADRIVEAEVLAIGSKCQHPELVVGCRALVDSYMGTRRKFDDLGEVCVYDTEDVVAILT